MIATDGHGAWAHMPDEQARMGGGTFTSSWWREADQRAAADSDAARGPAQWPTRI